MKPVTIDHVSHKGSAPCAWVGIGTLQVLTSYDTVIAFRYGQNRYRLRNAWGTTTGRHFNEAGAKDYEIAEPERFQRLLADCLRDSVMRL